MALRDPALQGSSTTGEDVIHLLIGHVSDPILESHLPRPFSGDASGGNYCISQGPSKKQMACSER